MPTSLLTDECLSNAGIQCLVFDLAELGPLDLPLDMAIAPIGSFREHFPDQRKQVRIE